MSQLSSGLAAVLAAIEGSQPAGETIARSEHMAAVQQAATAAFDKGRLEGEGAGLTSGARAERDRVRAIMGAEAAKGREQLASHFAFETDMSVDAATAALAAAPKATASRLDAIMPGITPKVTEPSADAPDTGASLNGAVDALVKRMGLAH